MLLITEYNQDLSMTESIDEVTGAKSLWIEGIFMQSEVQNKNGRVYERAVLENAVNIYTKEQVATGRAVGELNHPPTPSINLDRVSHAITELRWEGDDVVGKAKILDTPMGQIVKGLIEGGVQLGVSSRGTGTLSSRGGKNFVNKDYTIATVDIVQDPSAGKALVNGIMEGVDWALVNGVYTAQSIKPTVIDNTIKSIDDDSAVRQFKNFLNRL